MRYEGHQFARYASERESGAIILGAADSDMYFGERQGELVNCGDIA